MQKNFKTVFFIHLSSSPSAPGSFKLEGLDFLVGPKGRPEWPGPLVIVPAIAPLGNFQPASSKKLFASASLKNFLAFGLLKNFLPAF
jgi:hypothetical protein